MEDVEAEESSEEEILHEDTQKDARQENKEEPQAKPEDEMREKMLRLAAEFDNYKKRSAKELENSKLVGKAEAISKLLPNIDEFELALAATKKEDSGKGILLVYSNIMNTLKSLGLKEIETDGAFDPYKHEIVLMRESETKEGVILEVIRKGYTLGGIMLRPASVIVSSGEKSPEKQEDGENKR